VKTGIQLLFTVLVPGLRRDDVWIPAFAGMTILKYFPIATQSLSPAGQYNFSLFISAFIRIKVAVAIRLRIALRHLDIDKALADHFFGHILIIRPPLFFLFAIHADGIVIVTGKDSFIVGFKFFMTAGAFQRTKKYFFPVFHYPVPPLYCYI
jgi:hypothetical protein